MAVYTHVDRPSLEAFLNNYELGTLEECQPIAEGVENSNYLLKTDRSRYILTLFEQRTPERDLPFFIGLKRHLHAKGFPCPLPIPNHQGECLAKLCGRPATIVSFLEGKSLTTADESECRQVGQTLGRLHRAASDFSMSRVNGLALGNWRPLMEESQERADEVSPGLAELLRCELDLLESSWPTHLPGGVIHADLFRDNVFFQQKQLSGVIDFYFACNDLLAYDLAITLNAWSFSRVDSGQSGFQYRKSLGSAILDGYQEVRPLTGPEREHFPTLCRGAAIRFLLTRLYDWLNVPPGALTIPHDPLEYLAKLKFHQDHKVLEK